MTRTGPSGHKPPRVLTGPVRLIPELRLASNADAGSHRADDLPQLCVLLVAHAVECLGDQPGDQRRLFVRREVAGT